jgi:hypothetical protein
VADLSKRIIRAARLEPSLYEEVEADRHALGQAMLVVFLAGLAAGLGSIYRTGWFGVVLVSLLSLVLWYVWAFLTYFIGTKLLAEPQTRADHKQLLRTIGFAAAPGILLVLGILPWLGPFVLFAVQVWMLVAMIIAVKQALDYTSMWRAVGVCVIGWIVITVLRLLLLALFLGARGQL